jgi:hypothetical protein
MKKLLWSLMILFGISVASLPAQDKGEDKQKFGLVFSANGSNPGVGAIWNLGSHVAFSPYINFTHSWNDANNSSLFVGTNPNKANTINVGAKLPLYLKNWEKTRLYVAPGYEFSRNRSQSSTTSSSSYSYNDQKTIKHDLFCGLGVQYAVGKRVSIFGDMGFNYQYQRSSVLWLLGAITLSPNNSKVITNNLGFKDSIGIIFYLK